MACKEKVDKHRLANASTRSIQIYLSTGSCLRHDSGLRISEACLPARLATCTVHMPVADIADAHAENLLERYPRCQLAVSSPSSLWGKAALYEYDAKRTFAIETTLIGSEG